MPPYLSSRLLSVRAYDSAHAIIDASVCEGTHVADESIATPGFTGWWAVSGDMPNDHVSASKASNPREAVRAIAPLWQEAAQYMARGEKHPTFRIGSGKQDEELAPMLASRAELLLEWVSDPQAWEEDEA
ncbi:MULTISPECIES: DUF4826 family protein [unclassified Rhizobacter]|uniref:DUF4826 family protein n=1 Tax=unclassified Rhizobacter TaxID=2640088 RepID=UPI0006F889C0|nr:MULTISPECIES: DUF4826 family protein [unclassified Rhizobacter]KQU80841.1 hypothetical protein ASC88_14935 [Rhizobacter sp. Root29]KQW04384.1 hypothetical protein ASC98_04625 [Rhizobacter sp. Root1238]KRB14485.1 hypothetical protein ASE08_08515 [Rhizobacter sp. Root16D2]